MGRLARIALLGTLAGFLVASVCSADWREHEVRLLNGAQPDIRVPAKIQIVSETWNRVAAVPYIAYMPEKSRVLMLVACDSPHHAEILFSDDCGATWSNPKRALLGFDGFGTSLTYLGKGKLLFLIGDSQWVVSDDFGDTWEKGSVQGQTCDGKPWYMWDPLWVDKDPKSGDVTRLIETGYTTFTPPEVDKEYTQGYIRFNSDLGKTWGASVKVPQWKGADEIALIRAANGELVAACRTSKPPSKAGEWIDHFEGLGVSISQDDGAIWSAIEKLYDYGRHHPSLVRMPDGRLVMSYVVRKGYVDTPDGFPQFGIEAVVSNDNGHTWDLDHRYILHAWKGNLQGENKWCASSQATSTVLLPDGSLLTAFGTGFRSQPDAAATRDAGIIRWHLSEAALDDTKTVRAAATDSDARNVFDPGLSLGTK